MLMAFMPVI